MSDPVNETTIDLIKRNEGCELTAYRDSVGVLTIGYGHTGPDVTEGLRITQQQAEALLRQDLEKFQDGIDDVVTGDASDNQFGAMVSLAFNIGLGHFKTSSVLRDHNAGDHQAAADAFLLWNKAGGQVLPGLDRRRHEERRLYLSPDPELTV
jgi:lysozyme